jgi:hypothetical protein
MQTNVTEDGYEKRLLIAFFKGKKGRREEGKKGRREEGKKVLIII